MRKGDLLQQKNEIQGYSLNIIQANFNFEDKIFVYNLKREQDRPIGLKQLNKAFSFLTRSAKMEKLRKNKALGFEYQNEQITNDIYQITYNLQISGFVDLLTQVLIDGEQLSIQKIIQDILNDFVQPYIQNSTSEFYQIQILKNKQKQEFTCSFIGCCQSFKKKKDFKDHIRRFHQMGQNNDWKFQNNFENNISSSSCSNKQDEIQSLFDSQSQCDQTQDSFNDFSCKKKVYKCNYPGCQQSFDHSATLRVHKRLHVGKPYFCTHCQNQFQTKKNLQDHIFRFIMYKPYKCQFCTKKFFRVNERKNHINKSHNHQEPKIYKKSKKQYLFEETKEETEINLYQQFDQPKIQVEDVLIQDTGLILQEEQNIQQEYDLIQNESDMKEIQTTQLNIRQEIEIEQQHTQMQQELEQIQSIKQEQETIKQEIIQDFNSQDLFQNNEMPDLQQEIQFPNQHFDFYDINQNYLEQQFSSDFTNDFMNVNELFNNS